ncbi:hypothetical protein EYF80_030326 [Liparis tanakae]|uniref:Uncharacterized protein n=1 Tax=Liparis tanakae TaxID=230148 RepID=A0A4Z2H1G1_9TELE|nr:hypothetical protein EYF80_030326 [Liparis tanakae]
MCLWTPSSAVVFTNRLLSAEATGEPQRRHSSKLLKESDGGGIYSSIATNSTCCFLRAASATGHLLACTIF